ncbi:MAG TPA: hypothetical protein VF942_02685 [Acidimicrobiales bacterium]
MAAGEPAAPGNNAGGVERYEQLRRRALGGQPDGLRLGLAVLQRQGLAAWLHAWDDLGAAETAPKPQPPGAARTTMPSDEVVAVLASMTLACAGAGGAR